MAGLIIAAFMLPLVAGILYGLRQPIVRHIRTIDQNYTPPSEGPYR